MALQQPADDGGFAPRAERGGLAGARHVLHHPGALHQQVVDLGIDAVEFGPQRGQPAAAPVVLRGRLILAGGRRAGRSGRNIDW